MVFEDILSIVSHPKHQDLNKPRGIAVHVCVCADRNRRGERRQRRRLDRPPGGNGGRIDLYTRIYTSNILSTYLDEIPPGGDGKMVFVYRCIHACIYLSILST